MTSEGPTPPEGTPEPPPTPPDQPPPSPQATPPPAGVPPATPPIIGEPAKTGMSGCAKAAIIGGAVILVIGIALVGLVIFGVMQFASDVEESLGEESCQFMTSDDASDVIGTEVQAISGDSAIGAILGLIRDTRLLPDAPSCYISSEDGSVQVWISVYDGSDAAEVFAAQADIADGQIVTQETTESGTLTVETEAFRGEDVPGLGEEAFCVDIGAVVTGGVFARSDDRVVYVTALAASADPTADVFGGELCQRTVPVAEALLG